MHLAELGAGAPTPVRHSAALAEAIHGSFVVAALVRCIGIATSVVRGSTLAHRPEPTPAGT